MATRGVRGAVIVPANEERAILDNAVLMISRALELNGIRPEDIAAIFFTVTPDLDRAFPARAARELGLVNVPLLDFQSPEVEGDAPGTIRMMLLWNTDVPQDRIRHCYLGDARRLRPDLVTEHEEVSQP